MYFSKLNLLQIYILQWKQNPVCGLWSITKNIYRQLLSYWLKRQARSNYQFKIKSQTCGVVCNPSCLTRMLMPFDQKSQGFLTSNNSYAVHKCKELRRDSNRIEDPTQESRGKQILPCHRILAYINILIQWLNMNLNETSIQIQHSHEDFHAFD